MAFRQTLSSNGISLFLHEEPIPGVLASEQTVPETNLWWALEPNTIEEFGSELELVARRPLSEDRQSKKGVIVGGDTMAGFNNDLTVTEAVKRLIGGFLFAASRTKKRMVSSATTATGYTVPSGGAAFLAGDLIFVKGHPLSVNNGLKVVGGSSTATEIKVAGLTAGAGAGVTISHVGFEFASGDAVLDTAVATYPALTATAKDMTAFGLVPGEIVYLGGDTSGQRFTNGENSGWCRVKSVVAGRLVFDKTDYEMSDDAGTGKTVRLFFGEVIKNEVGALIKRRTFAIQRSLGKPDLDNPTLSQSDHVRNAICNELTLTMGEKEIMNVDFGFVPTEYDVRTTTEGIFTGSYEVLPEVDAYNTAGDIKVERLAAYPPIGAVESAPEPLFALIREGEITINNNAEGINAHRYVGYVDISEGMFEFGGTLTAYFARVEALQAIKRNSDCTYMVGMYKNNAGWALDMPLVALGDGQLDLSPNEPIEIGIDMQASTGAKYDVNMNHTGLFAFFDYLPSFADRRVG